MHSCVKSCQKYSAVETEYVFQTLYIAVCEVGYQEMLEVISGDYHINA